MTSQFHAKDHVQFDKNVGSGRGSPPEHCGKLARFGALRTETAKPSPSATYFYLIRSIDESFETIRGYLEVQGSER